MSKIASNLRFGIKGMTHIYEEVCCLELVIFVEDCDNESNL